MRNEGQGRRVSKDPGQHRRCRRLSVRARNNQNFFSHQKFVVQNLRHRTEWNALVEHALQFHIARARARYRLTTRSGRGSRFALGKRLRHRNPKRFQKRRHRRIRRRIGTRNAKAALLQHAGE